jgi:hypothetical protein
MEDERFVVHNNNMIPFTMTSHAEFQRILYSSYYAGMVAKGGVAVQPS